jgi:RNA polymerase sigma factor (TIGR02999 family)
MPDVTTLLQSAQGGSEAANRLFDLLYSELRSLARGQLRRSGPRTPLGTTTLVHESYLRFLDNGQIRPEDRRHFLAYASHVMRSVLVDHARGQLAAKRGAGVAHASLDERIAESTTASDAEVVAVHDALDELARHDPRLAQLVEMKYFGGLTEDEVAAALEVSVRTVQRDWGKARLLLRLALTSA